jgi:MFS family permease
VIFLTVFLDLVGFSVIFPLFPAMLEWYLPREGENSLIGHLVAAIERATPGSADSFLTAVLFGGILGSLYSLLQFVASPIWGRLSDRFGRRQILLFTVGGTFLSYILWIFSAPFALLVVARIIGGLMAGNIAVATAAVADVTTRETRTKGMGLIGMAFGLGFIVGPAIGGLSSVWNPLETHPALSTWGLHPFSIPAAAAALLALGNWIWVWRRFPETRAAAEPSPTKEAAEPTGRRGWFTFVGLPNPAVRLAVRAYFVFLFAFSAMEFTLTFLAVERLHYNPREMTLVFLFVGFILAFTQGYFVRKYGQRCGEVNLVLGGCLAGLLGLCCLGAASSAPLFYAGLALMGVGIGLGSPALSSLVSLYAPADQQGAYLGAFRSAGALARAVGPAAGAAAFWWLGSRDAYFIGAAVVLVSFFVSLFLPRVATDSERESPAPSRA